MYSKRFGIKSSTRVKLALHLLKIQAISSSNDAAYILETVVQSHSRSSISMLSLAIAMTTNNGKCVRQTGNVRRTTADKAESLTVN